MKSPAQLPVSCCLLALLGAALACGPTPPSIVLVTLDNIQEDLENPYDNVGVDDVNLDVSHRFDEVLKARLLLEPELAELALPHLTSKDAKDLQSIDDDIDERLSMERLADRLITMISSVVYEPAQDLWSVKMIPSDESAESSTSVSEARSEPLPGAESTNNSF